MAGIVNSTKKRLLINKKIKEVEVPTAVLNTAQFLADLNTVGGNAIQSLILSELGALPTIIKNESVIALVCGAYKEGKVYGYNGDTKSIEEFNFERNSSGTRTNAAGQLEIVPVNIPRIDYDMMSGQLKGYLFEKPSTNFLPYSGFGNYGSFQAFYDIDRSKLTVVTEGSRQCVRFSGGSVLRLLPLTIIDGKKYTYSFWLKALSPLVVRLSNYSGSSYNAATINVTTQWQRFSHTFEAKNGSSNDILHISDITGGALPIVFIADLQFEEGGDSTSYIPTTTAVATRLSDKISGNRPMSVFNKNSWYVDSDLYKGWFGNGVVGLKIIGRNYIKNSALFYQFTSNNSSSYEMLSGIENGIRWISGTSKATGKFYLSTYTIPANEPELSENMIGAVEIITSVDLMSTANITVKLGTSPFNLLAGVWQRVSAPGLGVDRVLSLYADSNPEAPVDTKLYYKNYKLERGTVATPWSPAPEDFIKIASNGNVEISSDIPVTVRSLSLLARQLKQEEI